MRGIALRPDGLACAESEAAPPNSPSHSSPSFFRSRSFLDLTTKQPFLVLIPALLLFLISFFRSLLYSVLLFHFIAFAWLDNFLFCISLCQLAFPLLFDSRPLFLWGCSFNPTFYTRTPPLDCLPGFNSHWVSSFVVGVFDGCTSILQTWLPVILLVPTRPFEKLILLR